MSSGLREQKRKAAHLAMETAAVEIAYNEGVGAVTVERVCAQAQVSRSTFFNYFASLYQAIFGSVLDYSPKITQEILEEHHDNLVMVSSLIVMRSVRGDRDNDVTRKRYALFIREPGVTNLVSWNSHTSREGVVAVLKNWLDQHPQDAKLPGIDHSMEARIAVALSISVGDEYHRLVQEVDGEYPFDQELYESVCRKVTAILQPQN